MIAKHVDVDTYVFYLGRRGTRIKGNLLHGNEEEEILDSLIFRNGPPVPAATESVEQVMKPLEIFLMTTASK